MNTNKIISNLSKHENSFYPLRFISSDFFLPYWCFFSKKIISKKETSLIQRAARNCVDHSMNGELIYWNICFSEKNSKSTWKLFYSILGGAPEFLTSYANELILQLLVSQQDSVNSDYFINLITRLRFDEDYRKELAYDDTDVEILDAIYEQVSDFAEESDIEVGWLNSDTPWDRKLKDQTPDFPESVYIIFSMAYDARSNVPLFKENIDLFFGESKNEKNKFIARLKETHKKSLNELRALEFPLILLS